MVLSFWLLTGTIGFYAAYMFIRKIYAAVKIDWVLTIAADFFFFGGGVFCLFVCFFVTFFFYIYFLFFMTSKHWLVCRGSERVFFYGATAPPTGFVGEEQRGGTAKPAVSLSFSLSVSLPRLFPLLSLGQRLRGNSHADGTVHVFCCFTLHTTQWAKAFQTMVSAHVRFVFLFCVIILIYPSFYFLSSQESSLSKFLPITSWEAFVHLIFHHTSVLTLFSIASIFKCDFGFTSEALQIREGLERLNCGYGVNFVVSNWYGWKLWWELLHCNTRKDKLNVLLFFTSVSTSWCDHVTHNCNQNISLSFQNNGSFINVKLLVHLFYMTQNSSEWDCEPDALKQWTVE